MTEPAILLVEDNAKDEMLVLRALKRSGLPIRAVVVRDGVEALEYLHPSAHSLSEAERELPIAVFLDFKLPKMSGLEVLRRIRAHSKTRNLPVVLFSSSDDEGDISSGYDAGANSYVRKPVAYDDFDATLVKLSEYWGLVNQRPPVHGSEGAQSGTASASPRISSSAEAGTGGE